MPAEFAMAQVEDARALARVSALSLREAWSAAGFRAQLSQPHVAALVARDAGRVVGYLLGVVVEDQAEVRSIAVEPAHRRHGLGHELLARFIEIASARAGTRLTLEVRESNVPARALYESFEMKVVGERAGYYRDGETALVYGVSL